MPQEVLKKNAQEDPTEAKLLAATTELCTHLCKGKNKKGETKTAGLVATINSILKSYRKRSRTVSDAVLLGIVATMENGDEDFCSQMDTAVFCAVIDTILQADTYVEAQRGIHLLAASLHRDSSDQELEGVIQRRKELIGKECLQRLLAYFTDMEKDASDGLMRRWAGILCIELLRGSEENTNLVIEGPDDTRRNLGLLILHESDEIIRLLAGETAKTLSDGGTSLEDIWPISSIDSYEGFPLSSESQAGWVMTFSRWIDEVYARDSQLVSQPVGQIFFIRGAELKPKMRFGAAGQFLLAYITEGVISILAPSINGSLDQLFDAPLKCFKAAYSKSDHSSQLEEVQIILELQPSDPPQTILDAIAVKLDTITVLMDVDTSIQMIRTIKSDCPTLDIGALKSSPLGSEPRASWSQIPVRGEAVDSPTTDNTHSRSRQNNGDEEASPDPLSLTESRHYQEDYSIDFQDEDLYHATPPRSSKQDDDKGIADNNNTIRVETAKPKSRAAIKLKAKPPIIQNSRGSTSNQRSAKAEVLATKKRNSLTKQEKRIEGGVGLPAKPTMSSQSQEESRPSRCADAQKSTSVAIAGVAKNSQAVSQTKVLSQENRSELESIQEPIEAKNAFDIHEGGDITSLSTPVRQSRPPGPVRSQKPRKIDAQPILQPSKKRYSLQGLHMTSSAPSDVDPFEIPDDPVDLSKMANTKAPKPRAKANAKTAQSVTKSTKKKGLGATEPSEAKKRQSAPAVLNESKPRARESKRAAAAKAKARIHNADDSDEDFEAAITSYDHTGSESNRKSKAKSTGQIQKKESQALTKALPLATEVNSTQLTIKPTPKDQPTKAQIKTTTKPAEVTTDRDVAVAKEVTNGKQVTKSIDVHGGTASAKENPIPKSVETETDIDRIQQDDARELGLIEDDSAPRAFDDDLPMDIFAEQPGKTPAKPVIQQKVNAPTKITGSSPKKAFAEKLGNLLEGLTDIEPDFEAGGLQQTLPSRLVNNKNVQPKVQDPVFTTSPFPPSSNLMEQTSPDLIIVQPNPSNRSRQEGLTSDIQNQIAKNEPPAREQPKHLSTPTNALQPGEKVNSSPKQDSQCSATKQGQIVAPSNEFRKPDIEAIRQVSKNRSPQTERISRSQVADKKPVQTSGYKMVAGDMEAPTSSTAKYVDGNIEQEEHRTMKPKEFRKKRKSTASDSPLAKRQRKQDDQVQRVGDGTVSQASESNRKQVTRAVSPELPEHPPNAVKEVERKLVNESASKDPSRKPNIIVFSSSGPLNQGNINTTKQTTNKTSEIPVTSEVVERKRKRKPEKATDEAPQSPPKKRQHSSPVQCDDNFVQFRVEGDFPLNDPINEKSPGEALGRHARSRSNRHSSQTSRVDEKGSPVAAGDIDHMRNLKERMSQSARLESPHDDHSTDSAAESPENDKQGSAVIFAPKVELEVKEKARVASPQEVTSRYIAHERTAHGHYKGIQSQEVVAPETELADPFKDAPSRSTPFIERLRRSSKEGDAAEAQLQGRHLAPPGHDALPLLPRQSSVRNRRSDANNRTRFSVQEDSEKTLVGSGLGHGREISLGDMRYGSSPESRSSGQSTKEAEDRAPLGEMIWNVALRPHYATAREAIHLIADEVIIRLSDEEDRMSLLVKQYDENGAKIMDRMTEKREKEKAAILQDLDSKSKAIVAVYTDAKDFIRERAHELKESPISGFEKEWTKRQDDIQKLVSSGMSSLL